MKAYVATRSKSPEYALEPGRVIEVCAEGPDPLEDAISYARDETVATDQQTYVLEVDFKLVRSLKTFKTVDIHVHS